MERRVSGWNQWNSSSFRAHSHVHCGRFAGILSFVVHLFMCLITRKKSAYIP